ncbi:MAG TPA: alanine racemase C-terminal domain-containing protein, partial [Gemmatimonadaceae bacterium]
ERDDGSLQEQEGRFEDALACLPSRPPLVHAENSAALARTRRSRWSLGRPGVFLYGVGSGDGALVQPEPVVRLCARIAELRTVREGETVSYGATYRARGERRIATLPLGYADGYRRALGNRGQALVGGRLARVAGIVTMDMTMIDVTGVECAVGDVVTLIGRDGEHELSVEAVANAGELSPYELLTGLRARLPRRYVDPA